MQTFFLGNNTFNLQFSLYNRWTVLFFFIFFSCEITFWRLKGVSLGRDKNKWTNKLMEKVPVELIRDTLIYGELIEEVQREEEQ